MHIALLIDCETAKPDSIDGILGELAAKGTIKVAFGSKRGALRRVRHPFRRDAFRAI
jgi:hypothetical protein